jgi:hypothetical protein
MKMGRGALTVDNYNPPGRRSTGQCEKALLIMTQSPTEPANQDDQVRGSSARLAMWLLLSISVLLFVASLTQDGFSQEDSRYPCLGLLLYGWLGVLLGRTPAWLANPALVLAWVLVWSRPSRYLGLGFAISAVGLALSFLLHQNFLMGEGGFPSRITGYGTGYWLWVASTIPTLLGCAISLAIPKIVQPEEPER